MCWIQKSTLAQTCGLCRGVTAGLCQKSSSLQGLSSEYLVRALCGLPQRLACRLCWWVHCSADGIIEEIRYCNRDLFLSLEYGPENGLKFLVTMEGNDSHPWTALKMCWFATKSKEQCHIFKVGTSAIIRLPENSKSARSQAAHPESGHLNSPVERRRHRRPTERRAARRNVLFD